MPNCTHSGVIADALRHTLQPRDVVEVRYSIHIMGDNAPTRARALVDTLETLLNADGVRCVGENAAWVTVGEFAVFVHEEE